MYFLYYNCGTIVTFVCVNQIRSGHFITVSQSICPSCPAAPNFDSWPYFSLKENVSIFFSGASTLTGGRCFHVQESQSFCVVCMFILIYGCLLLLLILLCTKVIYTCHACQSGICAADGNYIPMPV
jgi:hypothetical protein